MSANVLTEDFIKDAIDYEECGILFPIDFDNVWATVGYSKKSNAVRALTNSMLTENKDYQCSLRSTVDKRTPEKIYKISCDAFKHFCLMAQTKEGKEIRQYFIDVEKTYRKWLEQQFFANPFHEALDYVVALYEPINAPISTTAYAELARLHSENNHLKSQVTALQTNQSSIVATSNDRKVFLPDKTDFKISFDFALGVIGYKQKGYLRKILVENFVEQFDWEETDQYNVRLTEACFHELAIVARPQRGAMVQHLPEVLIVERDRMFRAVETEAINLRFGKRF